MKSRCYVAVVAISTVLWLGATHAQDYNSIDGVTSASGVFKLLSGKAYADHAELTWRDGENNGSQHLLKYGKSTSYGSEVNLKPFRTNTDITTTVSGLDANTQYYGQFYRYYNGRAYNTNFQFTTPEEQSAIDPVNPSRLEIRITSRQSVALIDATGRVLKTASSEDLSQVLAGSNTLRSSNITPGFYMAVVTDRMAGQTTLRKLVIAR